MTHPLTILPAGDGVAPGGRGWCGLRSSSGRPSYTAPQTFFWLLAKFLTRVMWRTKIEGPFPIPGDGKAVIICNHRSSVDPFFVQISLRRVVHWMVAREYCVHPVFGFFLRIAEVDPGEPRRH